MTKPAFSVVIPVYNNDEQLKRSLSYYNACQTVDDFEVVVVLDGYDSKLDFSTFSRIRLSVWHVDIDIPCNQPGARNLGAYKAAADLLAFVDVDHRLDLQAFASSSFRTDTVYLFKRYIEETGAVLDREGPGSLAIARSTFTKLVGYDEDFSGHWGFEDLYFIWQATVMLGLTKTCSEIPTYTMANDVGMTPNVDRDTSDNFELLKKKRKARKRAADPLRFPYSEFFKNFDAETWHPSKPLPPLVQLIDPVDQTWRLRRAK